MFHHKGSVTFALRGSIGGFFGFTGILKCTNIAVNRDILARKNTATVVELINFNRISQGLLVCV